MLLTSIRARPLGAFPGTDIPQGAMTLPKPFVSPNSQGLRNSADKPAQEVPLRESLNSCNPEVVGINQDSFGSGPRPGCHRPHLKTLFTLAAWGAALHWPEYFSHHLHHITSGEKPNLYGINAARGWELLWGPDSHSPGSSARCDTALSAAAAQPLPHTLTHPKNCPCPCPLRQLHCHCLQPLGSTESYSAREGGKQKVRKSKNPSFRTDQTHCYKHSPNAS